MFYLNILTILVVCVTYLYLYLYLLQVFVSTECVCSSQRSSRLPVGQRRKWKLPNKVRASTFHTSVKLRMMSEIC